MGERVGRGRVVLVVAVVGAIAGVVQVQRQGKREKTLRQQ